MAVTKTELGKVITKLDDLERDLLRLRARFLPKKRPTPRERKLIEQGRIEMEKGRYVTLSQLRKEYSA